MKRNADIYIPNAQAERHTAVASLVEVAAASVDLRWGRCSPTNKACIRAESGSSFLLYARQPARNASKFAHAPLIDDHI